MAVSSFFMLDEPEAPAVRKTECVQGEGRDSELARQATAALLWPDGRPGAWLLVTTAACVAVLLHALMA